MKLAFTLCSNNYVAQAKTLGDSLVSHNPDYRFVIGLVDRQSRDVDYTHSLPHELVSIERIGIDGFDEFWKRYNIIELNTAVKPFFFDFIFQEYPAAESVVYFDPDIMVFGDLEGIEQELAEASIVLTPHILSPIPRDGCMPDEETFLRHGVFNLGFLAVANKPEGFRFLEWWAARTRSACYVDSTRGLFVDQLWINLVPVVFGGVGISRNPGFNVAYWNLHERRMSNKNGIWLVNDSHPLVFYHFSAYNPQRPSAISAYQTRYSFETRPDLSALFKIYRKTLLANQYSYYTNFPCHYVVAGNGYRAMVREMQCAEDKEWLQAGFLAYERGDLLAARRYFLAAIWRNPLVVRNLGILSILVESFVGSEPMKRYRRWRRTSFGASPFSHR